MTIKDYILSMSVLPKDGTKTMLEHTTHMELNVNGECTYLVIEDKVEPLVIANKVDTILIRDIVERIIVTDVTDPI